MTDFGPLANPCLCIMAEGDSVQYKWQVLFKTVACGEYSMDAVKVYLEELRPCSGFKTCPGLKHYPEELRFDTKNVHHWGLPFNRIDAKSYVLWHVPHNIHHPAGDDLRDTCQPCQVLHHDISNLVKKADFISLEQKLSRTSVHSKYPLKYLSPKSKAERVSKMSKEHKNLAVKLSSITDHDYNLNDKQHAELLQIVCSVNEKGNKAIEKLCSRGDQILSSECNPLREVWRQDVIERLEYERDQKKNGMYMYVFFAWRMGTSNGIIALVYCI